MMARLALALLFTLTLAASEGGGHVENLPAKWVNFGIVVAILGYFAVKIGGPALRQRADEIVSSLSAASRRSEEAKAQAAAIDQKMAGLQKQVDEVRAQAKAEMQRELQRFSEETAHLVAKIEANAQAEIASAAKHARAELQTYSAQLALDLARQKVAGRLDGATQNNLIDSFVRSLN